MSRDFDADHLSQSIDAISNHTELAVFIKKLHQNFIDDPKN
jgi:hypothetical protein